MYTSNNYDVRAAQPCVPLYTRTCACVCVCVRVASAAFAACACTSECSRGQIHARAYKQTRGWSWRFLVGCRLGAAPVHVVVYEKVRRAIKFTGSVLHRAARVALGVCMCMSMYACTLDTAGWKRGKLDEFSKWRTMAFVVDIGHPLLPLSALPAHHPPRHSYFVPPPARIHFPFHVPSSRSLPFSFPRASTRSIALSEMRKKR